MAEHITNRRSVLAGSGVALVTTLAGCSSPVLQSEHDPENTTPSSDANGDGTEEGSVYTDVYREAISSVVLVRTAQGGGTGFQYDENHVVTNAHVVGRSNTVQLRFDEGEWREGTVQGADPHSDLAVISLESVPESANPLPLVEDTPAIGQEVIAIGNPYNLDGTVTTGVVSGTDRLIPSPAGYRIPDSIQTDAAVNPGNSGGPLMSLAGDVVAVINSGGGDNIAFGISAALVLRVIPTLIDTGSYEHAYLGVSLENVTPAIAEANDMSQPRGQLVVETTANGPADGILEPSSIEMVDGRRLPVGGDVILEIEGVAMETPEDLASYLALQTSPGDTIEATVLREGSEETRELTLGSRPERSQSPLR